MPMPRKPIREDQLRSLWNAEPYLTIPDIAVRLDVSITTVRDRVAELGLPSRRDRQPFGHVPDRTHLMRPLRSHEGPVPTRWRCVRCGGTRVANVLHACHEAEAFDRGLLWERAG